MVKYLIDTNVYINALKGNVGAQTILIEGDILLPFIVLGELEYVLGTELNTLKIGRTSTIF